MRMPLFLFCLVLLFTLGGCRSLALFTDTTVLSDERFGQLWKIYTHCQSSIETDEMREDMQHLSQALHRMSVTTNRHSLLPQSVQRLIEEPPSRLSVDPGAMAVACALRAGVAAQTEGRTQLAAELFGFILSKDREPPYTYYVVQARLGLAETQNAGLAIEGPGQVMRCRLIDRYTPNERRAIMGCTRCGGLMIIDGLLDESGFRIDGQAERCLNCGHLEDRVILANRASACGAQIRPLDGVRTAE